MTSPRHLDFADLTAGGYFLSVYPAYPGLARGRFPFRVEKLYPDFRGEREDQAGCAVVRFVFPLRSVEGQIMKPRADELAIIHQGAVNRQWYHTCRIANDVPIYVGHLNGE